MELSILGPVQNLPASTPSRQHNYTKGSLVNSDVCVGSWGIICLVVSCIRHKILGTLVVVSLRISLLSPNKLQTWSMTAGFALLSLQAVLQLEKLSQNNVDWPWKKLASNWAQTTLSLYSTMQTLKKPSKRRTTPECWIRVRLWLMQKDSSFNLKFTTNSETSCLKN